MSVKTNQLAVSQVISMTCSLWQRKSTHKTLVITKLCIVNGKWWSFLFVFLWWVGSKWCSHNVKNSNLECFLPGNLNFLGDGSNVKHCFLVDDVSKSSVMTLSCKPLKVRLSDEQFALVMDDWGGADVCAKPVHLRSTCAWDGFEAWENEAQQELMAPAAVKFS